MMGDDEFTTWIAPLAVRDTADNTVTLTTDNLIVGDWVRDHLLRDIETVARSHFGPDFRVTPRGSRLSCRRIPPSPRPPGLGAHPFNPTFTFDRFVVGSSNQFAAAAAEAVAERPGAAYNPLYIYGGSGLGKTHLLHAIANRLHTSSPRLKVVYMTTEQFVNELINCIRRKQMDAFRQTFRGVDMLLLDDIQFIAGKERTQEEFFHTFNTLQSTGRQVVFTSDARPADIPGLEERLRSRFLQGLIADIQPPDLETRCAILREKARAVGRELPEDVVLFISRRIQNNVRELEGCLNRTIAYAQLKNAKITIDVVRMALYELLARRTRNLAVRHHPLRRPALRNSRRRPQGSIQPPIDRPAATGRHVPDPRPPRTQLSGNREDLLETSLHRHVRGRQRSEDAAVEPRFRRHTDLVSSNISCDFHKPPVEVSTFRHVAACGNRTLFPHLSTVSHSLEFTRQQTSLNHHNFHILTEHFPQIEQPRR